MKIHQPEAVSYGRRSAGIAVVILMIGTLGVLGCGRPQPVAAVPQPAPKTTSKTAPTLKPLPKGETRVFEAIVMKVVGVAQARADRKSKWRKLKLNDVLKPGVLVRTGRKSLVALRVGPNATLVIDRQTRVAIPQIVQDGDTLKTRVGVEFGRIDVKGKGNVEIIECYALQ